MVSKKNRKKFRGITMNNPLNNLGLQTIQNHNLIFKFMTAFNIYQLSPYCYYFPQNIWSSFSCPITTLFNTTFGCTAQCQTISRNVRLSGKHQRKSIARANTNRTIRRSVTKYYVAKNVYRTYSRMYVQHINIYKCIALVVTQS